MSAKRNELSSLGFFKGKEKKALQAEIDDIQRERDEAWKTYHAEASAIKEKYNPLYADRKKNSTRIEEIKKELTMDR